MARANKVVALDEAMPHDVGLHFHFRRRHEGGAMLPGVRRSVRC